MLRMDIDLTCTSGNLAQRLPARENKLKETKQRTLAKNSRKLGYINVSTMTGKKLTLVV